MTTSEPTNLALSTYVKLMRAAETVTARCHRHLAPENLTVTQFGVLEALFHLGPLCQKELARKLLKSSGNITTVIDNLEKRGLVERSRALADRRYQHVSLSPVGHALIERIFPRHCAEVAAALELLSPAQQAELGSLCRILGRGLATSPGGTPSSRAEKTARTGSELRETPPASSKLRGK